MKVHAQARTCHLDRGITLKVLANVSPGLRFGNPGKGISFLVDATLKELRRIYEPQNRATPSGLRTISSNVLSPGFQSKPWADIGQRFQRYY
jgi:hypothetical protein